MKHRLFFTVVVGLWCGWTAALAADPAAILTFAAITDIQYADRDTIVLDTRFYRNSPAKLAWCAEEINRQQPAFIIQLGDLTDSRKSTDVATITTAMKCITVPWRHVLGNHDAGTGNRDDHTAGCKLLTDALGFKEFYYTFALTNAPGWSFVVLDGTEAGYGAIGAEQLNWFRGVLKQAQARDERVICFCHFPLINEASPRKHIMAKPEPILEALDNAGCVVAWICGHDHSGGYALRNGVHHLTLQGTVETKDEPAFAIIRIFPDHLSVTGFGRVPSRELPLAPAVALRPAA
ncbi:MAG: metallophosphoesterase [Kiritimatiellaeota bacterium]|nr:metallophosphoesterase [Kiritimatiellota bacterium]